MSKMLAYKHISEKWASRAGLRLLSLLIVLALTGCYPSPYREISRPMPGDTSGSRGAPITQVFFYPKCDVWPYVFACHEPFHVFYCWLPRVGVKGLENK